MTEHADQLRDAFQTHEYLAPDPAVVYAKAQELARTYRRRRLGAQAAGGAVLGAGLIAGGLAWPGGGHNNVVVLAPAAAPAATPTPTFSASPAELDGDWAAYFAAGYGYDDAVKLAKIWGGSNDPGTVKAEAGAKLLAGETLPIKPGPESTPVESKKDRAVDAFFSAGYDYDDAVTLAQVWNEKDIYQVKAEAGQDLLDGKKLPIKPSGATQNQTDSARAAFFTAGYDYNDAVKLGKLWHTSDTDQVKADAGQMLINGKKLPIQP